ncbi:MAG: uracil permease [Acidobacteria bacterium]|nr:uracil permease [Acidobacteriota bacterium]
MAQTPRIVGIRETLPLLHTLPLSLQHLMAMFGATVLVPLMFKVDPGLALLMNGLGTLVYSFFTRGGIPAYLGSSFAFIAPTLLIISKSGYAHAQSGFIVFGLFFVAVSFVIRWAGTRWLDIVMPAPVMGAVVAVIGLELAPAAASMSGLVGDCHDHRAPLVAGFTLICGIVGSLTLRGRFRAIPVLTAVSAGYALAAALGMVDHRAVAEAAWLTLPDFHAPVFDAGAILIIAPAMLVVLAEHVGHLIVTGNITGEDLVRDPGLHRSLLGDGVSNVISGFTGAPPNTTYGENIGVMAITRVYSVWVIRVAALIAVAVSFLGKFAAIIRTIPVPVMGGICLLLFGVIAASGIRVLVERRVDLGRNANLVMAAVVFIVGVSGAKIEIGTVELKGMALAAVTGIAIALLLHVLGKLGWLNDTLDKEGME